ncbi:MAG: response regulator transcription factor [Saprospiraceae bacterium]
MKNRILLVEDNDTLGYVLKEYLEMKDFAVEWAADGKAGFKSFRRNGYDLCILDVMLPEMDGFALAQEIKTADADMPIIFLTAKSLKVDKLKGFNLGADDYVVKPVDEEELVARIKAVLNRTKKSEGDDAIFQIGRYTFDVANQKLESADSEEYLTEMEAQLLKLLCLSKGNLVGRQFMLKTIWGKSDYFTRRSMDVFISRLRKYLSGDKRIKITNIHGSGFILTDE